MKLKFLISTTFLAGILSAGAFSLDFTGLNLEEPVTLSGADGEQLVIFVPGFGNVAFGVAEKDITAEIALLPDENDVDVPAIEFDATMTITVDFFAGSEVENVMVDFVALNTGEDPEYIAVDGFSGQIITDKGTVGIAGLSFDRVGPKIPEPSTTLLGLLGAVTLLRRRR